MNYFCAAITGICLFLLLLSCSESDKGVTVKTLIPLDPVTYYDTVEIDRDTVKSGTGTKDSVLADTVTVILPKTDSISWIMVSGITVYDTTYVIQTSVDSITVTNYIIQKVIYDTASSSGDTLSDTAVVDTVGTHFEIFVVNNNSMGIIDTIIDSAVLAHDTNFVTSYVMATTSDPAGVNDNLGLAAMDWLTLDTVFSGGVDLCPVQKNSRIYTYSGKVYVLEKDSIKCFASLRNYAAGTIDTSVAIGTDLRHISFVNSQKAYIIQYTNSALIELDLTNFNDNPQEMIGWAGVDSLPYMVDAEIYEGKLYVLCQRLKPGPDPAPDSLTGIVVVIAVDDNSFVDSIPLTKKKPMAMAVMDGMLYVSSAGKADTADGGIEKIDLTTNTLVGDVLLETDSTIQNLSDIVLLSSVKGYIRVTSPVNGRTDLFEFNPATGAVGERIFVLSKPTGDVVYDGRFLYVADRNATNPGVVIINPAHNSIVAGPVSMGAYAPNSLTVMTVSKR